MGSQKKFDKHDKAEKLNIFLLFCPGLVLHYLFSLAMSLVLHEFSSSFNKKLLGTYKTPSTNPSIWLLGHLSFLVLILLSTFLVSSLFILGVVQGTCLSFFLL